MWRWSGLEVEWIGKENEVDWIGVEEKEGSLVTNPGPKTHFFEKTHKAHFQKKTLFFRGKKAPQGYPPADARWVRAGPGPRQEPY